MGPDAKRKLQLRHLPNPELFSRYDDELVLKLHAEKNLKDTRRLLNQFREFLGDSSPSSTLAKSFLTRFTNLKPRTLYRYTQGIRMFMRWYGDSIDDVKIKIPKSLPPYTEDADVDRLLNAIRSKQTHKMTIERDILLVVLALATGLRRAELAHLKVRDVHLDFLEVRQGKNSKDRVIPLNSGIAGRLHTFIASKAADDSVFGLTPETIGNKIRLFAKKAGLSRFHTHTLRQKFATDLLEKSGDPRAVQELMGHENLSTLQSYTATNPKRTRAAIKSMEKVPDKISAEPQRVKSNLEADLEYLESQIQPIVKSKENPQDYQI